MPRFHDCHFHIQNLTHPHPDAFFERLKKDWALYLKLIDNNVLRSLGTILGGVLLVLLGSHNFIFSLFARIAGPEKKITLHLRYLNLLLMMNRPLDEYFKAVHDEIDEMVEKGHLKIGNQRFDKVYVHGLIMDYTDRDYQSGFTDQLAYAQKSKPVVRQTEDILAAMKRYRENLNGKPHRLVVLPFLGMNPENYDFEDEDQNVENIGVNVLNESLLPARYFGPKPAFDYINSGGRFTWFRGKLSKEDLAHFEHALKPDLPQNKRENALRRLEGLKKRLDKEQEHVIRLYVNLETDKLSEELKEKFVWKPDTHEKGGTLTWGSREGLSINPMAISERNQLIEALEKKTDGNKLAHDYSLGRIEFLFRWIENMSDHGQERETLQDLLQKYFKKTPRLETIEQNQSAWTGNIDEVGDGIFAGIKLYPPLGFDPWPEGNQHRNQRKARVRYLYKFAQEHQIPVTVHTSDGGFQILPDKLHYAYTSPERWIPVMENYPNLRINFAHCGVQDGHMTGRHDWKITLFKEIICKRENGTWKYPNAYADLSDLLNNPENYQQWEQGMSVLENHLDHEQWAHLENRLLFGSDFMVNLRQSSSYGDYLSQFTVAKNGSYTDYQPACRISLASEATRFKMAVTNAERFLGLEA